jgi:ribosomal protein S18 acetylase RimI-like enzyme
VPPSLLSGVDTAKLDVVMARLDGTDVATGLSFDHDGDCGIFNVATLARARRRGLGAALTEHLLHAARRRGCTTASLQSTAVAERVYRAVGFRDLGRILEYVP